MKEIWNRLKKWLLKLKQDYPNTEFKLELNKGVSEESLHNLEKIIGKNIPLDFKNFYKIHNWEVDIDWVIKGQVLLSIEDIIEMYEIIKTWNKEDLQDFWWDFWDILVFTVSDIDFTAIDLETWKICLLDNENKKVKKTKYDLKKFLEDYSTMLENWDFVLSDTYWVVSKEDLKYYDEF